MSKIVVSIIISVAAGLILVATGWNFSAVADIPKTYETKEDHQEDMNRIGVSSGAGD